MKITPDNITSLGDNEIFVFGSNYAGRHGAGAAKIARQKFGAQSGTGTGPTGRCYAIATKDGDLFALSKQEIEIQVDRFLIYTQIARDRKFLVTAIGCGLAGFTPEEIAPMFRGAPDNVSLPKSFWDVLAKGSR